MTSDTTRRRAPSIAAVATAAACVFLVIVLFLAAQLRAGHDPGLGTVVPVAAKQAAAPAPSHSSAPLVTKSSGGG